ncbi:hypothetical protein AVEN_18275-1 [Araneus ventricosus]|uniref:Uncharacterized protein n=1 Tax=Araneus ventricosus TaxID=182803 RepID=A0A4Y2AIZ0_ARAVE|nr:hypothetical protein AVEN_18275-1 [Araneus ventricosus]
MKTTPPSPSFGIIPVKRRFPGQINLHQAFIYGGYFLESSLERAIFSPETGTFLCIYHDATNMAKKKDRWFLEAFKTVTLLVSSDA